MKRIRVEPAARRVTVRFNGTVVADSTQALVLHEAGLPPVYYLPPRDVRMEYLIPTDHQTRCPYKGLARYWTVRVGDRTAENAAWSYPEPDQPDAQPIAGYLAFYPDRLEVTVA